MVVDCEKSQDQPHNDLYSYWNGQHRAEEQHDPLLTVGAGGSREAGRYHGQQVAAGVAGGQG